MKLRFNITAKRAIAFFIAIIIIISDIIIPASAQADNVFSKNKKCVRKVALTFDDGPHPKYTKQILEILSEYGITATFFVIGENAVNYPEALQAIKASGCEIGNHTFSHHNISGMSCTQIKNEIQQCESVINDVCSYKTRLFRPPEGSYGCALENVSKDLGYNIILWSIDTRDWAHTPPEKIVENVMGNLGDGDIILMHDYISGGSPTCETLRIIIPAILSRGYEFVTVSSLIMN